MQVVQERRSRARLKKEASGVSEDTQTARLPAAATSIDCQAGRQSGQEDPARGGSQSATSESSNGSAGISSGTTRHIPRGE
jgi:hypothetical protein